jgi:hypothetical protein
MNFLSIIAELVFQLLALAGCILLIKAVINDED